MRRELKAGVVGVGLLGLLLVIALAARGSHPGGDGEVTPRPVPASVQDSFVTLLAIAYVIAIAIVIVLFFWGRQRWHEPEESHWLRNYVTIMVVMAIATGLGYFAITHGWGKGKQDQTTATTQGQQQPTQRAGQRTVPARQAHFVWPVALGVVGLVVLGGVVVYLRRRRETFGPRSEATLEEDLARAVEVTIDDLRREGDARRAVVAAYAQMEAVLADHGLARRRADAPLEYLSRILRELEVRESAVRSLTVLFEYAKFSPHEIDASMKEQAIEALIAVRDDLQPREPVPA
jgi:NADH:ubiquinone oxidoreductase subunit 5 (subunit L)/multisubunit Na+/H+ antiporter MnhA subunit